MSERKIKDCRKRNERNFQFEIPSFASIEGDKINENSLYLTFHYSN